MYMSVRTPIYIYIYIYIHVYGCVYMHVYIYAYIYIYMCVYVYMCTRTWGCTSMYLHMYIYVCICICICTYVCRCMCIYVYIYTHINELSFSGEPMAASTGPILSMKLCSRLLFWQGRALHMSLRFSHGRNLDPQGRTQNHAPPNMASMFLWRIPS